MTTQHTPGPWGFWVNDGSTRMANELVVRPLGEILTAGTWIADCGSKYDANRIANARLIAAAPELLKALQTAQMALAGVLDTNATAKHAWRDVRYAISKATNGQA